MKFMEKNTNCTRNFVKIEMINVILCKIFLVIFSSMETISAMLSCQSFWKKNLNTFWFWMCMTTYIVYVYFNIPLIIFYNKSKKTCLCWAMCNSELMSGSKLSGVVCACSFGNIHYMVPKCVLCYYLYISPVTL